MSPNLPFQWARINNTVSSWRNHSTIKLWRVIYDIQFSRVCTSHWGTVNAITVSSKNQKIWIGPPRYWSKISRWNVHDVEYFASTTPPHTTIEEPTYDHRLFALSWKNHRIFQPNLPVPHPIFLTKLRILLVASDTTSQDGRHIRAGIQPTASLSVGIEMYWCFSLVDEKRGIV